MEWHGGLWEHGGLVGMDVEIWWVGREGCGDHGGLAGRDMWSMVGW